MSLKMKVPFARPYFDKYEFEEIVKPLEAGLVGLLGQEKFISEFEGLCSGFVGATHAMAASNSTAALHTALLAHGIKPGDKVVVPAFLFPGAANAVEYTGAEPVFCDIDVHTFNIDTTRLEEALDKDKTGAIKAVVPVNMFGLCAELPAIVEIAKARGIVVIEDCAGGLGAYIGKKHSGTFGDAGCFSYNTDMSVTTNNGGLIVTNNEALAEKAKMIANLGADRVGTKRVAFKSGSLLPEYNMIGFDYAMTGLQAALGCAQMKKAAKVIAARADIAMRYDEAFKDVEGFRTPFVPVGYTHAYQSYVCLYTRGVDSPGYSLKDIDRLNADRNAMMAELDEAWIETRQGAHAVQTLGFYRNKYGFKESSFYFAYMAERLSIALPLYAGMTEDEFYYVVEHVKGILRRI